MSIELIPLGHLRMVINQEVSMRGTPVGSRVVVAFTKIRWEGDLIRGRQIGKVAGDWLTVGPDGTASLEIRFSIEDSDAAIIYVHGYGRAEAATFSTGSPIYFSPFFETNHEKYAWLNRTAAIGKGRVEASRVTFEMYQVV